MGQWSGLPADLLILIDKDAVFYQDKIRLRCICASWQSALPELPDLRQPQPPWLLLPYESGSLCGLYHPLEDKVYEVDLPELGEKVFKGSGHGWVVTVLLDGSINIVNPLTRVRVPLPPIYTFPDVMEYHPDKVGEEYLMEDEVYGKSHPNILNSTYARDHYIFKIALSCSPASGDFVAVANYRSVRLAYCKPGDEKWHDLVEFDATRYKYRDITFLGGKLYALPNFDGIGNVQELMVCDDVASCPKLRKCLSFPGFATLEQCEDLINSSHGLMLAERCYKEYPQIEGSDTEGYGGVHGEGDTQVDGECNDDDIEGYDGVDREGDDDATEGYDGVDGEGDDDAIEGYDGVDGEGDDDDIELYNGVDGKGDDDDIEGYDDVDGEGDYDDIEGYDDSVTYDYYTTGFDVYKVDMSSSKLIRMEHLDDEILFMGLGTQLGFSYKQFKTRRGNRIYFANHNFAIKRIDDCHDNGVFNFKDKSIKLFGYDCKIGLAPIWVMPDPY